ncbi:MAG: hypothetical protein V2B18_16135 [Pseudomonadota bacterium]
MRRELVISVVELHQYRNFGQRVPRREFALSATDEAIFFLLRFGDDPWHAADYNWWINPPVMRPDPLADLAGLKGGLPMSVRLFPGMGIRASIDDPNASCRRLIEAQY